LSRPATKINWDFGSVGERGIWIGPFYRIGIAATTSRGTPATTGRCGFIGEQARSVLLGEPGVFQPTRRFALGATPGIGVIAAPGFVAVPTALLPVL
jgi:hypothetical protein